MGEVKTKVASRVPPGDRWVCILDGIKSDIVFETLTDLLEYVFQRNGSFEFYMNAQEGAVYIVDHIVIEKAPKPEKYYSLYGEN